MRNKEKYEENKENARTKNEQNGRMKNKNKEKR